MYFKFFKPKSWDKRSAECRWLFIQSFLDMQGANSGDTIDR